MITVEISRGSQQSLRRVALICALAESGIVVVEEESQFDVVKLEQEIRFRNKQFVHLDSFNYKRERDYPTLKEGIRRKQIKSFRK